MIIEFNKKYKGLICEEVPRKQLKSIENRGGYKKENRHSIDPWDGEKPYAEDGFYVKYCKEY